MIGEYGDSAPDATEVSGAGSEPKLFPQLGLGKMCVLSVSSHGAHKAQ